MHLADTTGAPRLRTLPVDGAAGGGPGYPSDNDRLK